jgi:hypothetical protein
MKRRGSEEPMGPEEWEQLRQRIAAGGPEIARELLRVRDRAGKSVPLVANPAQLRFEQRRGRQNIVLKARQMGMTTWIAGRFFLRTISMPGTLTLQVAHTRAAAQSIFRIVQRMWEQLPPELRRGPLARSRANVGQMVFPQLDSEFRVASACDVGVGRGMSVQNLHCSEMSRWPGDAAEVLAGLRAGLAPAGELVLESTPNGADGSFYNEWAGGVDDRKQPGLVRHFLPWWLEASYAGASVAKASYSEEERELAGKHKLSTRQIGFRRSLERSYGALRSQEFAEDAETCFRATGDCYFEVSAVERRMAELEEPFETRRNGALQIYCRPYAGRKYVVAVDTAGGGSTGDFAAVQVVDVQTGKQCAELQQRLRPVELAHITAELAREYGGALVAVERNNHGHTVLAHLETSERYANVYVPRDGQAGWLTNVVSKPDAIARLGALLLERPEMFASKRLLGECRTYVSGDGGRTGAANGAHDDLVMAMAIAQAVRAERRGQRAESRE